MNAPGLPTTEKPATTRWLFVSILSCITTFSSAQSSINGLVSDGQYPVPGATVWLLHASDSAFVKAVVTDSAGHFHFGNIKNETYLLSVYMIGFSQYRSGKTHVNDHDVTIPDIFLTEKTTVLDEVTISAQTPLLEQQGDRLVIHVKSSVASSGNSILEVLQKSPGVSLNRQDNRIGINGKNGVRIMINGKMLQLPSEAVVQMLDGMSASAVDRIEIITVPPSEYDAEGNAGIIDIITAQDPEFGTNGTIGLTAGYKWAETLGGNLSINHRTRKFALHLDYAFSHTRNLHTMDIGRQTNTSGFVQHAVTHSHRENTSHQNTTNIAMEWMLTKKISLDLLVAGYSRNWKLNAITNDTNEVSSDSTIITEMHIHELNAWQSATASLGLRADPNPNMRLNFNIDYLHYQNDNPSTYDNAIVYEPAESFSSSITDLDKKTPIRMVVAKSDLQFTPSSDFSIEAGLKVATSSLTNDVVVRTMTNEQWEVDRRFTSYSDLNEVTGAIYTSVNWKPAGKWQLNGGVRYEYTHTSMGTPQQNLVDRNYGYVFPSVSLQRILEEGRNLHFSFARRITRPTYNDIAPFVFFWSPNIFSSGNTKLWPAMSNAAQVGYHNRRWTITVHYNHTAKEILSLFQPENDATSNSMIFRSQNLAHLNTLGISNTYSRDIRPWWEFRGNIILLYQQGRTEHLAQDISFDRYSVNFNLTNVMRLPGNITIELSGFYRSKSIYGISEFLPYGALNAAVKSKLGKSGTLTLAMDDILYTNSWRITTNRPRENLNSTIRYDWHNQYIHLTYSRKIGNGGLRSLKIKPGSSEEQGRIED